MSTKPPKPSVYDIEGRRALIVKAAQQTARFFSERARTRLGVQDAVTVNADYNVYNRAAEAYFAEVDAYKNRHGFGSKLINNAKIAGLMTYVLTRDGVGDFFIIDEQARAQGYELYCAADVVYRLICSIIACGELPKEYREELGICMLKYTADPEWICLGKHGLRLWIGDRSVTLQD